MKALSLWQPWATLIAIGAKRIETRSWYTSYRGPLAIHAAKNQSLEVRVTTCEEPFKSTLKAAGIDHYKQLPYGAIIATCELVACIEIPDQTTVFRWCQDGGLVAGHPVVAAVPPMPGMRPDIWLPPNTERSFGNYSPGRYAWILDNIKSLEKPVPFAGHQGFFNWEHQREK